MNIVILIFAAIVGYGIAEVYTARRKLLLFTAVTLMADYLTRYPSQGACIKTENIIQFAKAKHLIRDKMLRKLIKMGQSESYWFLSDGGKNIYLTRHDSFFTLRANQLKENKYV